MKSISNIVSVLKLIIKYGAIVMIFVETMQFLTDKIEKLELNDSLPEPKSK